MIHHIMISCLHTSVIVMIGQNSDLIRAVQDGLIDFPVPKRPVEWLRPAGNRNNQADGWMALPESKHFKRGNSIKSDGASAKKSSESHAECILHNLLQADNDSASV